MAYQMYLDGVLMPVTPSKVKMKIKNQNQTMTLISGEEINLLKSPGLTEVSFDLLLPQAGYPFANQGGRPAEYYLGQLERWKTGKRPFQWILSRTRPNGVPLFHSNLTVSLEDYQITESVEEGFDLKVTVNLKQYRAYGTKTVTLQPAASHQQGTKAVLAPPQREQANAPALRTYTVKRGDSLWNIAKKYLGKGERYSEIYQLNREKIKNPNLIYPGQVLSLPS